MDPRVEDLWAEARELPPEAREAWLAERCAGEPELREEVASLLRHAESGEALFDTLAGSIARLAEGPLGKPLEPGARVGPYEVVGEIGRGGMGVVYEGRDPRLERRVALKVLPPWLAADPGARDRLVAEARAASAIDHPNLATLYDVVGMDDDSLCLVLAHYEGETLKERLDRGPMPVAEAVDAVRQAARGLGAVHRRGIVHRDVKPANVFRTTGGRVVVLDFGIAKVRGADPTAGGARPGTVAYMAPEQAHGRPVDARTDVWALGVVLYEAIAGTHPFRRDVDAATLDAIERHRPPPLDTLRRDVPPRVARAVQRALATNPRDRPADASELERALEGGGGARLRRLRPWSAAAVALLLVAAPWLGHHPAPPDSRAAPPAELAADRVVVLPFDVAGDPELAYLREGILSLLSVSLGGAGGLHSVDPYAVLGRTGGGGYSDPAAAAQVTRDLGARRYVLGNVVEVEGRLRIQASLYDVEAGLEPLARVSVEGTVDRLFNLVDEMTAQLLIAGRGPGEGLIQVAGVTTGSIGALKSYLAGEQRFREGRFRESIDAFQGAVAQDSLFALAWYRLSVAAGWLQSGDMSLSAAETAARLGQRLPEPERRILEANLAWPRGESGRAERVYRELLAERPETAEAWYGLGEVLIHMNPLRDRSFTEARLPFERALAISGRDHAESLIHLADLAAWEGRAADYHALYGRIPAEGDLALVYETQWAFSVGDSADRSRVLESLEAAQTGRIRHAAGRTATIGRNPAGARRILRLLERPEHPTGVRAGGHLMAATLEAALGRWDAARVELDRAERMIGAPARIQRGWLAAQPGLAVPRTDVAAVRSSLEAWDPSGEAVDPDPVLGFHQPLYPHLRAYLMGLLSARLGDADGVRRQTASLARMEEPSDRPGLAGNLVLDLRARSAAMDDRPEDALRILDSIDPGARYDFVIRSPFYQLGLTRYLRAELLRQTGRPEDALRVYRAVPQLYFDVVVLEGSSQLRRAEILESLGRSEEAVRAWGRVADVWREADPALRPVVARAERRRAAPSAAGR